MCAFVLVSHRTHASSLAGSLKISGFFALHRPILFSMAHRARRQSWLGTTASAFIMAMKLMDYGG
jgi:hypothetical protein